MSRRGGRALHEAIRTARTETARGTFATLTCQASTTPLPRGNALLIPGFTGSKEDFAGVLPLLADVGWSVATYDQRGQYETRGEPDDDYSLDGFAADAEAVSTAMFGEAEQVHLVGYSFGGLVAGQAALRNPARWASLTLMCSGPGGVPAGVIREEALTVADSIPRDGLESAYHAKQLRDAEHGLPPFPPDVEAFNRTRFLASSPESLVAVARALATAQDRTADLVGLDLPITLVRGAHDTWPRESQDALAEALGTHVEVVDGAGHAPADEQPGATRDALARAWLS